MISMKQKSTNALGRSRQEDFEFQARMDYIVRPCLGKEKKKIAQKEKKKKNSSSYGFLISSLMSSAQCLASCNFSLFSSIMTCSRLQMG